MIIDDAKVIRTINRNILRDHGVAEEAFLEAEDGDTALKLAGETKIDLFLVDWNMPKIDGITFLKMIRSQEQYKDTPFIMITSEAARYNVMDAIEAGVTNYIVKPIKADLLWTKLKPYVEQLVNV